MRRVKYQRTGDYSKYSRYGKYMLWNPLMMANRLCMERLRTWVLHLFERDSSFFTHLTSRRTTKPCNGLTTIECC